MVAGTATINADLVGAENARAVVVAYDYTVLAGTQGKLNHDKKDRMFELAARRRLPVVLFAEGGGGRPGDTDGLGMTGLPTPGVRAVRPAVRAGPAGRGRGRAVLRGQRRAARLLRRHHRRRGRQHRHGRPGHDRGRRPRRGRARGGRPAVGAGAQRRRRRRGRRRGRGHPDGAAVPVLLPGPGRRLDRPRPAPCCATSSRRTGCASTTSAPPCTAWPTRARCWSCAAASAPG